MIQPIKVSDADIAFPASVRKMMPPWEDIPEEYRLSHSAWNGLVSRWFFSGLPKDTEFLPRDGVDAEVALRHVKCILGSWEPKHEHKEAAVAYLLSLWFEDVRADGKSLVRP